MGGAQQLEAGASVVLAFSGGLDTTFCAVWLREQGYQVSTVTVDTGGFSAAELQQIEARARQAGVVQHKLADAQAELFHNYLRFLIFANALRGGAYPLCVSAERVCQAQHVAQLALETGAMAIAHGSTGAGNDQVRFDTVFRAIAPRIGLLAPVRELNWSREQETAWLRERGIEIEPRTSQYSINQGLWGASIGGRETHDSWEPLPEAAYPSHTHRLASQVRELVVGFVKGVPASLDGQALEPVELIKQLNSVGMAYRVGRGMHLGDTILGIKGRVAFEAPAATLLISAHRELEKLILSARQQFWKDSLGNLYGSLVHEAQYFDPLCRDLEALLESSQACVTGEARLLLEPGKATVLGVRSPFSLLNSSVATYGEQNALWDGRDAEGFSKIYAVQQILARLAREGGQP